ncbi:MAG: hypothetical protein AB7O59_19135 [Pirellulales bacterium]
MHFGTVSSRWLAVERRSLQALSTACRALVLGGICLLAGATPCLGEVLASEADTSSNAGESCEWLTALDPQLLQRRDYPTAAPVRAITRGTRSGRGRISSLAVSIGGHRLANGLCAPLRC